MIKTNLKTAFRSYRKNKTVTLINILGLSVGIAVCLIIFQYVAYNLSYDKFNTNHQNLYRIERAPFATIAPSFVPILKKDFPEIKDIARITAGWSVKVKYDDKVYLEEDFSAAEPNIFNIMTFEPIKGSLENALQKGHVVITETIAKKYFDKEDPIGKTLMMDDEYPAVVSAVVKDYPENSHFKCNIIGSYLSLRDESVKLENDYFLGNNNFNDNVTFAYLTLHENVNANHVRTKFPDFIDRHLPSWKNTAGEEVRPSSQNQFDLVKVTDIHLQSHKWNELKINGDMSYIHLFSVLGILIIIIACINFFNLSTEAANDRSNEIGIKKVFGIRKQHLRWQFLSESLILISTSTILATVLMFMVQPFYKSFLEISANTQLANPFLLFASTLLLILLLSVVTGFIPGRIFERKNIAQILKGKIRIGHKQNLSRNALVIFQFIVAIGLFISIGTVFKQLRYINSKDLGFEKSNIILTSSSNVSDKWNVVQQRLKEDPNVKEVCLSHDIIGNRLLDAPGLNIHLDGKWKNWPQRISHIRSDYNLFNTYGIDILEGRNFNPEIATDNDRAFILNETAVRKLGINNNADIIGKQIRSGGTIGKVIGVVNDFNYESLHNSIVPMVFYVAMNSTNTISIKTAQTPNQHTIAHIKEVLSDYNSTLGFSYSMFEDHLANQYKNERKMMILILYASVLAIVIAMLGLVGLSLNIIRKRIKEIGVRKVNGAKITEILALLNKDFVLWILISFIVACPIAQYIMNRWLENFAYQTTITWWIFAMAGLSALTIALATVSWQSWRAANRNPVEALRYE
ncbi:ABC transporter permease [Bacteroidales bacterium]|nr:ABC transporter permease [Bacteroidales bacterium]